jgi:predicted acyl esterase
VNVPHRRHSRRSVLRGLGLLGAVGVGATSAFSYPVVGERSEGAYSVERELTIASFDGTELAASFYVPDAEGPHPSVLITHGWANTRSSEAVTALAEVYANNGYAVLTYDSRGFGDSGGLVGVDGPNEVGDARELITYLAGREEVQSEGEDPVVGMDGYSYGAGIQLRTAAVDDRIDAIVPRWAWHDLRLSNDPNGVVKWPWTYTLFVSGVFASLSTDAGGDGVPDVDPTFLALASEAGATGEAPDALREFWASRSPGPQGELADIEAPTLLVHGWHDRLFTPNEAFANYRGLENAAEAKLLVYDGGHDLLGAPGDDDPTQIEFLTRAALTWFERHLKGRELPESARLGPVTLYRSGGGSNASFESYDSLPARERAFALSEAAGSGTTSLSTAPGRPTTAAFDFDVDAPLALAGAGELTFRVTPRGGVPILSATLATVSDDGAETVLKDQVAVTRIEGSGERVMTLDLIGVEATLEAGETLRLRVGVDDGELAPGLTPEVVYAGTAPPEAIPDSLVPDDVPTTDGLYFDSPADPRTGVGIKHEDTGDSTLTVRTVGESAH